MGGRQGLTLTRRTASNETNLDVTGLDPGSSYSISVVAIAVVDDVDGTSIASDSFEANTTTTGELACTCTLYVHVPGSCNSSLEGATELKFAPFYYSLDALSYCILFGQSQIFQFLAENH